MKIGLLVFPLVCGALVFGTAAADPGGKGHEKIGQQLIEKLHLTPDQTQKMKELRKERREAMTPLFEQMKAMREKIKVELLKPEPSMAALDGYAAQMGELHKQIAVTMHTFLLRTKKNLSPEQFSGLLSMEWMGGPEGGGMKGPMRRGMGRHHPDKGDE